jgi:hypothetical protein
MRSANVPRSGFASTAMTRSERTMAKAEPRPMVVVVLPTPPLIESTAIRKSLASGCLIRSTRACCSRSFCDTPGLTRPLVAR